MTSKTRGDHLLNPGPDCVVVTIAPGEYAKWKEIADERGLDLLEGVKGFVNAFSLPGQSQNPCIHLSVDPNYEPPA